jgi:hypothetical protein
MLRSRSTKKRKRGPAPHRRSAQGLQAVGLVCSAACGADLIALEAAEQLGVRRRIVLPFAPPPLPQDICYVIDRPGDWGAVFDHQIATTSASGDLVVIDLERDGDRG